MRLKSSFNLNTLPNEGAVWLREPCSVMAYFFQMVETLPCNCESDRFTTHKWSRLLGTYHTSPILDMVEAGTRYTYTGDCVREP